jgi:hypothetical protein
MSLAPLMLTMIIPIILIKEPGSYIISFQGNKKIKKLTKQAQEKENVGLWESIKITIIHRPFLTWVLIFALFYFGLDLFLQGQVPLAQHSMGLNS